MFQAIHGYPRDRGLPAVESPFPYDLRNDLLADRTGVEPAFSDTPLAEGTTGNAGTMAAGDGRDEQ